jgi:two-component system response regulator HydG
MPGKRILLVEDDAAVRGMLDTALMGEGYAVDQADTAARARSRLDAARYDLVVADWRLPDGNGLDIADLAADNGIKTILMSGYLFQIPAEKTTRHELLMKPMRPSELVQAVKRLIG